MPDEVTLDYEPGVLRVFQTKSETKAFYDKIAKVYDLLAEHSERHMREAGIRLLAPAPGEHLLEIGFGTGHILAELANAVGPTGKVVGVDISENMLAHARDLLSGKRLMDRASLDCGDAEKLPYSESSMDGIFMCFTLELFDTPDIRKVLAECKRVLRPGGRIVVVAVSKEGKEGFFIHAFEWTHLRKPVPLRKYVRPFLAGKRPTIYARSRCSSFLPNEGPHFHSAHPIPAVRINERCANLAALIGAFRKLCYSALAYLGRTRPEFGGVQFLA